MNGESTLSEALAEVDAAIAAQNSERAIALANDLHAANPDSVAVWRARAKALDAAGRATPAADAYSRVLDMLPTDRDAVAALARSLEAGGNQNEARVWARQALDYWPNDEGLKRIASTLEVAFQPDADSKTLRASLAQARAGLLDRSIAGLQKVASQRPDRIDARLTLASLQWQNHARVAAAEICQSLLDEQPDCLEAHLILLQFWRQANAPHQEQFHLQAIERVDPDHRVTLELLGARSPLAAVDVPALREAVSENGEEDAQSRADWVADLIASSSSAPKPLERVDRTLLSPTAAADESDTVDTNDASGTTDNAETAEAAETIDTGDAGDIASFLPMEWVTPDETAEDREDNFDMPWLRTSPADMQRGFVPSKPASVTPDPRDGVPAEIEPLDWQTPSTPEGQTPPPKPEPPPAIAPSPPTAATPDEPPQEIEALADAENLADVAILNAESAPPIEPTVVEAAVPVDVVLEPPTVEPPPDLPVFEDAPPPKRKPLKAKPPKPLKEPKLAKEGREIKDPAELDKALDDAQRAMGEARFNDAVALLKKVIPSLRGKRLDALIDDLQRVIRERPRESGLWNMLGLAYTRKDDLPAALDAYRRAME